MRTLRRCSSPAVETMYPAPELPSIRQIRSAVDKALADVGFRRVRGAGYVRQIDEDFFLSVVPHDGAVGQSANVGAIYRPACVAAVEMWDQVGRCWIKGRRELSEGIPTEATTFCSGPVRDESGRQRVWNFCDTPSADKPVSVDAFAAELAEIAAHHVQSIPDVRAALASAELMWTVSLELRATVHAMLGDEDGFTRAAAPVLAYMEKTKLEIQSLGETAPPEFMPDFDAYFEAVRARFLVA